LTFKENISCLLASPAHPVIGQPRTAASLRKTYPPEGVRYVFVNGKVPKAPKSGEYSVTKTTAFKWLGNAFASSKNPDVDLAHFIFWYLPKIGSSFWVYWFPGIAEKRLPHLAKFLSKFSKPWVQENDTSVSQFLDGYMGKNANKFSWLIELSSDVINSKSNKALITWSQWAADGFARDGVEREKIRVIPLPFKPTPKSGLDEGKGQRVVLFVGLDYERKGGDVVLSVMQQVKREVKDAKLIYVGRIPDEKIRYFNQDWIEHYEYLERDKLLQLYSLADAFFMPTRAEAYGLSLLEAMGNGTPVVSTKVGAIPEIVCDECGYLHAVNDGDGMRESLVKLLSDQKLNAQKGKAAIMDVEVKHDPKLIAKQIHAVYDEALN